MTQRTTLAARWRSIPCAIIALSLFACSNSNEEGRPPSGFENSLLINYTGDYSSGELRWMATDSTNLAAGAWAFDQDSKVAAGGGNIFVLSRYPGVLTCISPEEIDNAPTKQVNLGDDAQNPYGAAVIGNSGYIAMNDAGYLQTFNTNTCALGDKINLPAYATNAAAISASGDTLLVVLQRLEADFSATKPGLLVRINATSKTLIDTIQLKFYNPNSAILSNGKLYVSSQRYEGWDIDLEKSGVEVVDLATGASEPIATGTELGGGAYGITLNEANQTLYIIVYEDWGSLPVKPLNLASKAIGAALPGIEDASAGIVFDEETGNLFVGDAGGLRVYNSQTNSTMLVNEGTGALPPYSLTIVRW